MQTYKLLQQDSVLLSQPLLIEHFGRAGAQFLSQLHYWLEKQETLGSIHQGIRWIYNSAKDWASQISISKRQMERVISKLQELEVIRVKQLAKNKFDRTSYYTINYEALNQYIGDLYGLKLAENSTPTFCRDRDRNNDGVYIHKQPNKDINKSEDLPIEPVGQGEIKIKQVDPVKRVKNIISKNEEKKADSSDQISLIENLVSPSPIGKTSTTQDMLEIWNETLGEKAKALMSKDLAPLLVSAYSKKFEQNFGLWRRYCELIKSSPYLMGEQFQLSIFWGLKFSTIDRIRAGEFGVKLSAADYGERLGGSNCAVSDDNQVQQMIEALDEPVQAKAMRLKIAQAIGAAAYHSWFHQARFETRDGEIQLIAPNSFAEQYWDTHYSWIKREKAI